MKIMEMPEMEVIRFQAEDVIVASPIPVIGPVIEEPR